MSKHGFTASYKYQVSRSVFLSIATLAAIYAFMILIVIIIYYITGQFNMSDIEVGFMDALAAVTMFIYGACNVRDFINTGAANGVSRATTIIAAMASNFTNSAACALFVSVISPLINTVNGGTGDVFLLEFLYGQKRFFVLYGESAFVIRIRFFVMLIFLFFFCSTAAMIFAAIDYRLTRYGRVICILLYVFVCIFGYPIARTVLSKSGIDLDAVMRSFLEWLGKLFGMAPAIGSQAGNCVRGVLAMLLFSAVFGAIAWLILRRAGAKPAAIRD